MTNSVSGFSIVKLNREFNYIYKKGKSAHSRSLVLFYLPHKEKSHGYTASKKVGNAVLRNSSKRRLRALFREISPNLKNGKYIFVAKEAIKDIDYIELKKDFLNNIKKLKLIDDKKNIS